MEATMETKFRALNDDCMEVIFGTFTLIQLMQVAYTCRDMLGKIQRYYWMKYRTRSIKIDLEPDEGWENPRVTISPTQIDVYGRRNAFRFIRVFGSCITNVTIHYSNGQGQEDIKYNASEVNKQINNYLHKFAGDSLETVSCYGGSIATQKHAFKRVTKLTLGKQYGINNHQMKTALPNLQKLVMDQEGLDRMSYCAKTLRKLNLAVSWGNKQVRQKIQRFFRNNRQINNITFRRNAPCLRQITKITKNIQALKKLKINREFADWETNTERIVELIEKHTKITKLQLTAYELTPNQVTIIQEKLPHLKVLQCGVNRQRFTLSEDVHEFYSNGYRSILTLRK